MCLSACSENANIGVFFTLFLSSEIVILLTFSEPKVYWSLQLILEHFMTFHEQISSRPVGATDLGYLNLQCLTITYRQLPKYNYFFQKKQDTL